MSADQPDAERWDSIRQKRWSDMTIGESVRDPGWRGFASRLGVVILFLPLILLLAVLLPWDVKKVKK